MKNGVEIIAIVAVNVHIGRLVAMISRRGVVIDNLQISVNVFVLGGVSVGFDAVGVHVIFFCACVVLIVFFIFGRAVIGAVGTQVHGVRVDRGVRMVVVVFIINFVGCLMIGSGGLAMGFGSSL